MRYRILRIALACAVCALGIAAVARAGVDVDIDPDPNKAIVQNETSIAILGGTPGCPNVVVIAYNDHPFGNPDPNLGLGVSLSFNGGATFTPTQLPIPTDSAGVQLMPNAFDPSIAADTQNCIYAAHISATLGGESGLFVHRYDVNTSTWNAPVAVSRDGPAAGGSDPNYRLNDKCHITTDRYTSSPYTDNVYVTWIKDRGWNSGPGSDIYFASSTDQGLTWAAPNAHPAHGEFIINDNPGTSLGLCNGPSAAVGSDGSVYVAWLNVNVTATQDPNAILFIDKSTDGGITWGTDVQVRAIQSCPSHLSTGMGPPTNNDARARSYPSIAVSPSDPNKVYVVYAEDLALGGPDEGDVFFIKSADGGQSWSSPLMISDSNGAVDQFEPWIAVKPDGTIDVAWYSRILDPMDTLWDVFVASSTDDGNSFSGSLRVTDGSFTTPTPPQLGGEAWMGEYLGIAVDANTAYLAFTSSGADPTHGGVYFDRFPNSEVPEPAAMSLLVLGLPLLAKRKSKRS